MKLSKRILGSQIVQDLLSRLAAGYIRLVYATGRWTEVGGDIPRRFWDEDKVFVLAFWHGRLLMMTQCWDREKPINMMISLSRDGRLISDTVGRFGIKTVAGSTSRGGAAALRGMLKAVKAGEYVGITPDGPRGPRMRAQEGVVTIARLAKAPIIPVSYAARNARVLGSWDRFLVPAPFARGVFVWGEPITVPHTSNGETLEAVRRQVEENLNAVNAEADRLCGLPVVEPAEAPGETGP